MQFSSTKLKIIILLIAACFCVVATAQEGVPRVSGAVIDPAGRPVAAAHIEIESITGVKASGMTGSDGAFMIALPAWGTYSARVRVSGFTPITRTLQLSDATASVTLRLEQVSAIAEEVTVSADVSEMDLASPDPSEKVMVREELLDANPGRPGAPISIPGQPIETAAGGIKAPQYFVPGVAGDHGEPIAQYIALGGYLVSNNLSANAHGNGYADPNIYISAALSSVATDGGAFNVLEGNHALNSAATYTLRPQLKRFITLTGDDRDLDLTVGFAPQDPSKREWLALETNYGNGLMRTLEHRQQYKWNAMRVIDFGRHEITLLGIGYWGTSHEGNLVPLGLGQVVNDTVDPRQKDQTHTGTVAADDHWKAGTNDDVSFSGFFRSYNLALFSNFGEGLIRQSEFRTVEGTEADETHSFSPWLEALVGVAYNEDDVRRDNLDHYLSGNPHIFGPFLKVLANNITIRDLAPFVALHGDLGKHLRFYAGLRHEEIEIRNSDMLKPEESFDEWKRFENPKAILTWSPGPSNGGAGPAHWLPSASLSVGQAYFTQDPRISVASIAAIGQTGLATPFERSHSEQLVLEKTFSGTNLRVTLGRTTTTATLAKIDPDNGLAEDEGPGTMKFLTASLRHPFRFGTLQGVFSKADARDDSTGIVTREAPRTIFDGLATLDHLPMGLRARGEYEYVGHKLLDAGGFEAIPVGETRIALVRPFLNRQLELGANGFLARGYTGQTTETFAPNWQPGTTPYCVGGVNGIANDFDCGTTEQSVGVRMVSWVGASISWRFGQEK